MTPSRWPTLIFVIGALAVLSALGWVTFHALRLERREQEARADARFQESIRLVLWRMDAAITPVIAREAARPYFEYRPFYPANRAYTRMLNAVEPGEVLVPSPLLQWSDQYLKLHFQQATDDGLTSPEVPTGDMRTLAEATYVSGYAVETARQHLDRLGKLLVESNRTEPTTARDELTVSAGPASRGDADSELDQPSPDGQPGYQGQSSQAEQSVSERAARQQVLSLNNRYQTIAAPEEPMQGRALADAAAPAATASAPVMAEREVSALAAKEDGPAKDSDKGVDQSLAAAGRMDNLLTGKKEGKQLQVAAGEPVIVQSEFAASWVAGSEGGDPELLFSRQVVLAGTTLTQGFWLDWPALRASLLGSVSDLLPSATLRPVLGGEPLTDPAFLGRTLAAIPAELVVDRPVLAGLPAWSPVRTTLVVTWFIAVAAIASAAGVLRASLELAERRGRFVSAVTHELRTPLTTFCLYSQMLADGMVRDSDGQRTYLNTLKSESQRLAGIVESVLDYARLGRGRRSSRVDINVPELLARLIALLRSRCDQAGMQLVVEASALDGVSLRTDPATLERILHNLIDNACKYASAAPDKRVHLGARATGKDLVLTVQDHGAGVDRAEQSRIFRPFYRGHRQSDGSVPGLGLGLALSRGLARQLGGDLRLVPTAEGAEFRLRVPLSAPAPSAPV